MANLTIADWCSLTVSVASLITAIASTFIAKRSLTEAALAREQGKEIADRAHDDWAQQKWFDLYFKVDQAYNALEYFQTEYHGSNPAVQSKEQIKDYNQLMHVMREAHTMALVFPKNPTIDALFASTVFSNFWADALQEERLKDLFEALDLLRQKALMDPSVLVRKTLPGTAPPNAGPQIGP
jgi:hypothetical protein